MSTPLAQINALISAQLVGVQFAPLLHTMPFDHPTPPPLPRSKAIIFSKMSCPYCTAAKGAFAGIGVAPHVVELDALDHSAMAAWQDALGGLTGARSVPRVFVGGAFLGGGDDTVAAARSGKLAQLCKAAGLL